MRKLLLILALALPLSAQNWSGIIDPSRAIDWTNAGYVDQTTLVKATVPDCASLTVGQSVAAQAGTTSCTVNGVTRTTSNDACNIETALNAQKGTSKKVALTDSDYYIINGLFINNYSNVALCGAGPNATTIHFGISIANTSETCTANVITVVTSSPHGMTTGSNFVTAGISNSLWNNPANGGKTATVVDASTFTYPLTCSGAATGGVTIPGQNFGAYAGPSGTIGAADVVVSNAKNCNGGASVCYRYSTDPKIGGSKSSTWSAGYTQGTTSITLATPPSVNTVITLDENDDAATFLATSVTAPGSVCTNASGPCCFTAGTAYCATQTAHGFSNGNLVRVGGVRDGTGSNTASVIPQYFGTFTVTVDDATHFHYTTTTPAGTPACTNSIGTTTLTSYGNYLNGANNACGTVQLETTLPTMTSDAVNTFRPEFESNANFGRCSNNTSNSDGSGALGCTTALGGVLRHHAQMVKVTNVSGTTVTISPGLYSDFTSAKSPGAWWTGTGAPGTAAGMIANFGIGNITLDHTYAGGTFGGTFSYSGTAYNNCFDCWVRNVRDIMNPGVGNGPTRNHRWHQSSWHSEVRDSYTFGSTGLAGTPRNYGDEVDQQGDSRFENNLYDSLVASVIHGMDVGNVDDYNYFVNGKQLSASVMLGMLTLAHDAGSEFTLAEGNTGNGTVQDMFHGPNRLQTTFRNWFTGRPNPDQGGTCPPTSCTVIQATVPIEMMGGSRGHNVIGNVLGTPLWHNAYTDDAAAKTGNPEKSLFLLGFVGTGSEKLGTGLMAQDNGYPTDPYIGTTLFRWGNYAACTSGDAACAATHWCGNAGDTGWGTVCHSTSEVPTGLSKYSNAVPASETLPNSFLFNSQPAWYVSPYGTVNWPNAGPDVTGGSGPGGHAYKLPSQLCYEHGVVTPGVAISFDANTCYASASAPYKATLSCLGLTNGSVVGSAGSTLSGTCTAGVCASGGGNGCGPEAHNTNDTFTLTATASTGAFITYQGANCTTANVCNITVGTSDISVSAQFDNLPTLTLTASNGGVFNVGQTMTLTATVNNLANVAGAVWQVADPTGAIIGACSYPFDAVNCPITGKAGTFTPMTGTYTLNAAGGGVLAPQATQQVVVVGFSQQSGAISIGGANSH